MVKPERMRQVERDEIEMESGAGVLELQLPGQVGNKEYYVDLRAQVRIFGATCNEA